ncbi:MAG: sodium:solute symporter [Prolixibacteraceae bacterium]|jgi:Na+/proline symporter|nr:sodium:solute symporter [Prolixibacteraceae bacterium]
MSPILVFTIVAGYFCVLMLIAWLTTRKADNQSFFNANKSAPWYLVAFGMIGTTISGVTFISVPGEVGNSAFSYLQFVLGNFVGYWVIAFVLLPVYYRMNVVSIYSFLQERLGFRSQKTGSMFFIISKVIGSAFRLYLVAGVLQLAFFDSFGIPFSVTVCTSIFLVWVYTYRGGVKTIVWTDTLQTLFLLSAVVFTIYEISSELNWSPGGAIRNISEHDYSTVFFWDWRSPNNFFKQFLAGMFMTIVITGMDQDMMQKNLSCKTRRESVKNMLVFSFLFVGTVILFLGLGVMLYSFAGAKGIAVPPATDDFYPMLALNNLGLFVGIAFLIGITAAAYSSADSALTALTTSFCIDFLPYESYEERKKKMVRRWVHLGFSILLIIVILIFRLLNDESVVVAVFTAAGYTYGPLLGLFAFGLLNKRKVNEKYVPAVAVLSPVICYFLSLFSEQLFFGYKFGFELLILNGLLTYSGLLLLRNSNSRF